MQWSDISCAPSSRTLRQFAGLWILFFVGLACWQGMLRQNWGTAAVFFLLAAAVGPLGLVRPGAVRLVYVGWMILAFPIGWTVSHILLACLFYGVITPVGLVFRVAGRDLLGRRHRPDQPTYWRPKPIASETSRYFRQF